MSINVTVKGNPVSIRRGKMVTTDPDNVRKEFQKRRRMRLEQVRQQSKEIAQDVRDKVRKEKDKQLASVDRQSAAKLKEWQNRKLLQLQNQYEESLKDIGLGHLQALAEEDEEQEAAVNDKINRQLAVERGKKAAAAMQVEKNDKSRQSAIPHQQKKIAREIEKTRAAMVARMQNGHAKQQSKKRKKRSRHKQRADDTVNVTVESLTSESDVPELDLSSSPDERDKEDEQSAGISKTPTPARSPSQCPSPTRIPEVSPPREDFLYDDRISNRIKQRRYFDSCRNAEPLQQVSSYENCDVYPQKPREPERTCAAPCRCERRTIVTQPALFCGGSRVNFEDRDSAAAPPSRRFDQIPYKPTVSLKGAKSREKPETNRVERVIYYDHPNRFTKTCPAQETVERIQPECIEIHPRVDEIAQFQAEAYKRDKEAEIRGQIALEKEKIARDYEEMLRKLPVLQRQERIASIGIGVHDPSFHLSADRQKEREELKQNRLENQFSKAINVPEPAIITIPPLPKPDQNNAKDAELNLGTWDVIDKSVQQKSQSKTSMNMGKLSVEDLETLLHKLKRQRDMIMEEIGVLPKNSQLYILLKELEDVKQNKCACDDKSKEQRKADKRQKKKVLESDSSGSSTTPPVRKKSKTKPKANIYTQTTPRESTIINSKPETQDKSVLATNQDNVNVAVPCLCQDVEAKSKDMERICEIVIKIKEDNEPEVLVSPKKKEIIVKTDTVYVDATKSQQDHEQKSVKLKEPTHRKFTFNDSSSTSYYSIPDFNKIKTKKSNENCLDILRRKQKQGNVECQRSLQTSHEESRRDLDPRLIVYIKKLLAMSHMSVENLGVSTSSCASSPAQQSLLNNTNPLEQLSNIMKFYSLAPEDISYYISKNLNESDRPNGCPYFPRPETEVDSANALPNETGSTQYNSVAIQPDSKDVSADSDYPNIMLRYAEIAQNCHERISNLTAKIEKVRQEKQEILRHPNSSGSDKENSTTYLNLPSKLAEKTPDKSSTSTNSLLSESDELMKKLLEIDYSLASKLKTLPIEEINKLCEEIQASSSSSSEKNAQTIQLDDTLAESQKQNQRNVYTLEPVVEHSPFVPLLMDIKELPKLQQQSKPELSYNVDLIRKTKRPPPTKSFVVAQRNVAEMGLPHQLSTIIEADSQMSARLKDRLSTGSQSSTDGHSKRKLTKSQVVTKKSTRNQSSDSSTEKSDIENMEAMLRSMGMGWAVATLKKTQEALAQTSSSSSLDINISKKEIKVSQDSSGGSSVSLRSFLEKQVGIYAASNQTSTSDITHLMREIDDLSILHNSDENKNQRTSTPIQTTTRSRSTVEKSKSASVRFSDESDLSSVKSNANFISLIGISRNSSNTAD